MKTTLIIILVLLSANCAHAAERYRVEIVYFPQSIFNQPHGLTLNKPSPAGISMLADGQPITSRLNDPKVEKIIFPTVEVEAGRKATVDMQEDFKFASAYATDGTPTKYDTRRVGPSVTAQVQPDATGQTVEIEYAAENISFDSYVPLKTASGAAMKQPVFGERRFGPSKTGLRLGYWMVTETPGNTFALRVTQVTP